MEENGGLEPWWCETRGRDRQMQGLPLVDHDPPPQSRVQTDVIPALGVAAGKSGLSVTPDVNSVVSISEQPMNQNSSE